jgi:hypothetical protein
MKNAEQVAAFTLFEGIRELLAEVKILSSLVYQLSGLLKASDLNTAGSDSHTQYALFVDKISANLASDAKQVSDHFTSLLATIKEHPEWDAHDADDDAGYLNTMQIEWSSAIKDCTQLASEQPSSQAVPQLTTSILNALADIIKRGEILTFPNLVNQKLSDMQTGKTLNFFTEYANEFTNQADLQQVWAYLKSNPLRINGVMVDSGLIYRASASRTRRLLSLLFITLTALIGGLLISLMQLAAVFPHGNIPWLDLERAYVAMIVGSLAHAFIDIYKQYRVNSRNEMAQLNNWFRWVHINELKILWSIITIWMAFLIYTFLNYGNDWQTAFLIGYSVDSFLEAFLLRFTGLSTQRIQAIATPRA